MQDVHDHFPCPINSTTTACTLFAATDQSWEALAAFVGVDISTFKNLPVVDPVRSRSPIALRLIAFHTHVLISKPKVACKHVQWQLAQVPCKRAQTGDADLCTFVLQLMRYQFIPNAVLSSSQLLNGISYSTALPNEYLTVSLQNPDIIVSCRQPLSE